MLATLLVLVMFVLSTSTAVAAEDFKLKAEREEDGNVRLIWTVHDDPALHHYNIYWEDDEFDSVSGLSPKAAETGTTYVPQDLENGVVLYFAVAAVDDNGTVLVQDFVEKAQREPHLKPINFPVLMGAFILTLIIFILVIMKVPAWTEEHKGGA